MPHKMQGRYMRPFLFPEHVVSIDAALRRFCNVPGKTIDKTSAATLWKRAAGIRLAVNREFPERDEQLHTVVGKGGRVRDLVLPTRQAASMQVATAENRKVLKLYDSADLVFQSVPMLLLFFWPKSCDGPLDSRSHRYGSTPYFYL